MTACTVLGEGGNGCNDKEEGLLLSEKEGLSLGIGKGGWGQSWKYNNQQRLEGWEKGGREADAIMTVIAALEAAETMQRAKTAGWEERNKATAITKQQAPTPAGVQGCSVVTSWLGRHPPPQRHVDTDGNNNNVGGN